MARRETREEQLARIERKVNALRRLVLKLVLRGGQDDLVDLHPRRKLPLETK